LSKLSFGISFKEKLSKDPVDGRMLLLISKDGTEEPRFQIRRTPDTQLLFGIDVNELRPGEETIIDDNVFGYPLRSISTIPVDEYWVQALLHRYETFHRSDGHTVKLPMDRGEGQKWHIAPGNIYSTPVKVHIDPDEDRRIKIVIDQVIPPFPEQEDTKYVKHIKIQSNLLTEFWGRPMHLGAIVILPEGFDEHPEARYPLMIWHGHHNRDTYVGFRETPSDAKIKAESIERRMTWKYTKDWTGPDVPKDKRYYTEHNKILQEYAHEFYKRWTVPDFPRMILVQIQHANPYYDDSYAVNSANMGPYGDAITYELIPYIEGRFRGIGEGWARVMFGSSTGGWESISAQIFYPDDYNGCWCQSPDPIDFRAFILINIYEDENAYYRQWDWKQKHTPRSSFRSTAGEVLFTVEDWNHKELAIGTKCRSGDQWDVWFATYGPVDSDGYPKPLWDKMTGEIDRSVAEYWRENYDLRHIIERDWEELGPKLKGKIRIYCGDMDNYYLTNAVWLMEEFLEGTKKPYYEGQVEYGDRFGHSWYGNHDISAALDRLTLPARLAPEMAEHIIKTAPTGADISSWRY